MSSDGNRRRVAVVTGASSGIGAATARRLAADGYSVYATARRRQRLEDLQQEIEAEGGEARNWAGDIGDPTVCATIIREAAAWGDLEVLVANAGIGYSGDFDGMQDWELRRMIDVNVLGVMRTVRDALPVMKANGRGRIVIVGSVLSRLATAKNAVYCATKHALAGFADSLRRELRGSGVRVILVLPGYTATEFFDAMLRKERRPVDGIKDNWFFNTPEDVADVIAHRIEYPKGQVVVGLANTAVVFMGTRFPELFYSLFSLAENYFAAKMSHAEPTTPDCDPRASVE